MIHVTLRGICQSAKMSEYDSTIRTGGSGRLEDVPERLADGSEKRGLEFVNGI